MAATRRLQSKLTVKYVSQLFILLICSECNGFFPSPRMMKHFFSQSDYAFYVVVLFFNSKKIGCLVAKARRLVYVYWMKTMTK